MKMAIKTLQEASVGSVDLVPQAVFTIAVREFEARQGLNFEKGIDDLDEYQALYLRSGSRTLAFIHHKGEPGDGMTLYLERGLDKKDADTFIAKLIKFYDLPPASWREDEKNLHGNAD
jgi:hypothetical protein